LIDEALHPFCDFMIFMSVVGIAEMQLETDVDGKTCFKLVAVFFGPRAVLSRTVVACTCSKVWRRFC
jgi:hypothetical protein